MGDRWGGDEAIWRRPGRAQPARACRRAPSWPGKEWEWESEKREEPSTLSFFAHTTHSVRVKPVLLDQMRFAFLVVRCV